MRVLANLSAVGLLLSLGIASCSDEDETLRIDAGLLPVIDGGATGADGTVPDAPAIEVPAMDAAVPDAAIPDTAIPDTAVAFSTDFHIALSPSAGCAVFTDGRMKCWGSSFTGAPSNFGDGPGEMGANLPYVALDRKVRLVRGGDYSGFCAIFHDGGLRCWGGGSSGQASGFIRLLDATRDIDLGVGRTAVDVSIGVHSSCAILDDGSVKCWGSNSEGQLGQGDVTARPTPPVLPVDLGTGRKAKSLAAGYAYHCALLDNARVKCWGRNANTSSDGGIGGVLAIGNSSHMGNQPGEMGDNLPFAMLGTNPATAQPWKVLKIVAGRTHACALLENNRVKCWGRNDGGGALGSENNISYGGTALLVDDNMPFVNVGTDGTNAPWKVVDVDSSESSVCAVLGNGGVRCWGSGGFGATGRGNTTTIGDSVGEMGNQLPPVELVPGSMANRVVATGQSFCVTVSGTLLNCWGNNASGVLGQELPDSNTTSYIGDAVGEMGANLVTTKLE
jgi:E3 ubiquitin-protein ligase HERC3